jgi:PAS domain-containing protein
MRELAPDHEEHWFEIYGKVATTGAPIRFVQQANVLDARWFNLYAFRLGAPEERKVAVLFTDITEARRATNALAIARTELNEIIDLAPSFMAVFRGPSSIIEVANDAYRRLVGQRGLIGRPMRDAFPEVEGQGFSS